MPSVRRYIAVFSKEDETMVGEIALLKDNLPLLQKVFGEAADNPMYDCYGVTVVEEEALRQAGILDKKLNYELYDYWLEASRL